MKLAEVLAQLQPVDPQQLPEGEPRRQLQLALEAVELLAAEVRALHLLVEQQGDELRRLKGLPPRPPAARGTAGGRGRGLFGPEPAAEASTPAVSPEAPANPAPAAEAPAPNHSSERERRRAKPRQPKGSKLAALKIDREIRLRCDRASLPGDAEFKGWEPYVCQDLVLVRRNTRFLRAKFYSPSTGQTYLAPLPAGYAGQYGPGLQSLVVGLAYGCQVTRDPLHQWLRQAGIQIARSTVGRLLTRAGAPFAAEQQELFRAGLTGTPWVATDTTETAVNGEARACHVLGDDHFTIYCTLSARDRRSVLSALQGGEPVRYCVDAALQGELAYLQVSQAVRRQLLTLPQEELWDEATFVAHLDRVLPERSEEVHKKLLDAAALAAYWRQDRWPVVPVLLTDDASTYRGITEQALCWIHELRHYKKLKPVLACHREERDRVLTEAWAYYWQLLAYREAPTPAEADRLRERFDTLFGAAAAWGALGHRLALTHQKKEELLRVLTHPEVPLHNNGSELAARQRVRRRDVSFQARSEAGIACWDVFQSLRETTRKLGISFLAYVEDRLTQAGKIPRLAEEVRRRRAAAASG